MDTIKVLLVDDQAILLDGIKAILETDNQIKVIGVAMNGEEALKCIAREIPDVVLMDIRMKDMNGVECTRRIKKTWPQVTVVILTTFDDEEYIMDALRLGACGYLLKDINAGRLLQAVKDAYRGDTILPGKVAAQIVKRLSEPRMSKEDMVKKQLGFTDREAELAIMLAQGFTNKQIAAALYLSEGTTKNYISSIYRKLNVEDRTLAAVKLREIIENDCVQ